ncbi:MAG: hypothetical protein HUJ60_05410, partial [Bacilli bacterium]|nr:hypothetical protein [Bacilli bacterium]
KNMRIALWDAELDTSTGEMDFDATADKALLTWHQGPGAADEKYGYIKKNAAATDKLYKGIEGYEIHEYETTDAFLAGTPEAITGDMIEKDDCEKQYIMTLIPNEKTEIIMSMWYEGTMSTSSNAAIDGIVEIDFRLAWNFIR